MPARMPIVPNHRLFDRLSSFSIQAMVWPTTPEKGHPDIDKPMERQIKNGFHSLGIDGSAGLTLTLGDGAGERRQLRPANLCWRASGTFVAASFDAGTGEVRLYQEPLVPYAKVDSASN